MSSHYELIENAITEYLKLQLPKSEAGNPIAYVQAYPDDPKDLEIPLPSVSFFCGYTSSKFTDMNQDPLIQMEEISITGYLEVQASPGKSGYQGAYRTLKSVNDSLRGFYPLRGGQLKPLRPTSTRLRDQEEGAWLWELNFECTTYSNQDYEVLDLLNPDYGEDRLKLPQTWTISAGLWRVAAPNIPIVPSESDAKTLDTTIPYNYPTE